MQTFTEPLFIEMGVQASYAKEPKGAWLFRLLKINEESACVLTGISHRYAHLRFVTEETRKVPLTRNERIALESWVRVKQNDLQDSPTRAVFVVIADPANMEFILQRKDNKHPRENCRERLALLGGGLPDGVDAKSELIRELFEEVRDPKIADQLASRLHKMETLTIPFCDKNFTVEWFIASAVSQWQFDEWASSLLAPQGLCEALPAFLTRDLLMRFVLLEEEDPGSFFFAGTHHIWRKLIF